MKNYPKEWKVPVISKKVSKSKQQTKAEPSQQSTNPKINTRKATYHTKEIGGNTTTRKPRQKNTIPKSSTKENEHTKEINGGMKNDTNVPMQEDT